MRGGGRVEDLVVNISDGSLSVEGKEGPGFLSLAQQLSGISSLGLLLISFLFFALVDEISDGPLVLEKEAPHLHQELWTGCLLPPPSYS